MERSLPGDSPMAHWNGSRTDNRTVEQTYMRRSTARQVAMAAALASATIATSCVRHDLRRRLLSPPLEQSGRSARALRRSRTGRRRPQCPTAKAGLSTLVINPELEAAAMEHARDMADRHKLPHKGGDGSSPSDRMKRQGYRFQVAAETSLTWIRGR